MSHQHPYGQQPYLPYTQIAFVPYRSSTAHVVIAWVVAVLTAGYMLPWAIAATRNRRNTASIALIDLFLGWSLIGWVVALVMACSSDPAPTIVVNHGYGTPWPGAQPTYGPPAARPRWEAPVLEPHPGWISPPPAQLPPVRRDTRPEPTVIDPQGFEPTQPLPGSEPWARPAVQQRPYDPPAYGSEHDHRR